MSVQPRTDRLNLTAFAPTDSFEFIRALTDDRVRWQSGEGEVVVQVGGTLSQPIVDGQATFQGGAVSSLLLDNDITTLTGSVQFNLREISVEQLAAEMGGGSIAIAGNLPLLPSGTSLLDQASHISQAKQTEPSEGLTIALEQLPVSYDNLIQSVFDGQLLITRSLIEPDIGGLIEINDGAVQANQLLREFGSIDLPTAEAIEAVSPYRVEYLGEEAFAQTVEQPPSLLDGIRLQNLGIQFGDRLAILGQPLYNLTASGGITLNGPLSDLQPDGTIDLESGWINLFSTQFRLNNSAANTVTFTPEGGIHPYVDVAMRARVRDVDIEPAPRVTNGFLNAEINESRVERVGSVEYIRINAIAQGPATELADNLTSTSSAGRSQQQILALLGNNIYSGITETSLTQVAGFVGNSFEIKLFDILNSSDPPQFGDQYQITDEYRLRGASNLQADDTEIGVEYRIRF